MKKVNKILFFSLCIGFLVFCFIFYFKQESFAEPVAFDDVYQGANAPIHTYNIQPDGKIIIGGDFTSYNNTSRNRIARLNADGTLDTSFNSGDGSNNLVRTICIQPDGKIIIGGDFTSYNNTSRNRIARLNADGTLDTSFVSSGSDNSIYRCSIQPDGKIIITGDFTSFNGEMKNGIARLNSDGSLDFNFNLSLGAKYSVYTSATQPDGKILIGGNFTTYNGISRNRVARLNADGTLDTSFNPGSGANQYIRFIAIQPDGKILIGGNFTTYNGISRNRIARLNADGTLDTSFNPGSGVDYAIYSINLQPNNKIIINGYFSQYNDAPRNRIARLNADGTLDTSFNPGSGADNTIFSSYIGFDSKITIFGSFTSYDGTSRNRIARLNSDGTLYNDFNREILSFWVRGSWIKEQGGSAIYFLDMNNTRHAYINEAIWYSYFDKQDFLNIRTVSTKKLTSYHLGKNVPFNVNFLLKTPTSPKVYRVASNGLLQWIRTENTARELYGPNWNQLVHDLDEVYFREYKIGVSIE